jgi:hypothetical protein
MLNPKQFSQIIRQHFAEVTPEQYKAKGTYLTKDELKETLEDAFESALIQAFLDAFGGIYEAEKLAEMVNQDELIQLALNLINHVG